MAAPVIAGGVVTARLLLAAGAALGVGGYGAGRAFEGAADATESLAKLVLASGLVIGGAMILKSKL